MCVMEALEVNSESEESPKPNTWANLHECVPAPKPVNLLPRPGPLQTEYAAQQASAAKARVCHLTGDILT